MLALTRHKDVHELVLIYRFNVRANIWELHGYYAAERAEAGRFPTSLVTFDRWHYCWLSSFSLGNSLSFRHRTTTRRQTLQQNDCGCDLNRSTGLSRRVYVCTSSDPVLNHCSNRLLCFSSKTQSNIFGRLQNSV